MTATGAEPGRAEAATEPSGERRLVVQARLLGPFEILLPSGRVAGPWARPTARRLVQLVLLSRDHRIGREEVIEFLFPELTPERAANAVSKALSMARRALAEPETSIEIIRGDRSTIWIDGGVDLSIDLELHERQLRAALELPAGAERDDALETALQVEGRLLDDELYADWAIERRDNIDQLRRDARLALARDRSAGHGRADHVSVLDAWSALFSSDPTSEEAAISLMQTFARQGRRDEAVRTYHRCRAALHRLLDTEPSPALDVALEEAQRAPLAVLPLTSVHEVVTFGRDDVLGEIHSHLDRTGGGVAPSLAVLGPAGIGKSHVLATVRSRLTQQGWLVLHATSIPADAVVPYAAIRTALAALVDTVRAGTLLARVMGRGVGRERAGGAEASDQQMVLAGEIADLLDDAGSAQPVALVLDDAHWMEPALAEVTVRLASRPAPRRWALLVAARTDEPGAPVPPLASDVIRVVLEPLQPETLAQVVRERLGTRVDLVNDDLQRVLARSGGNPLFAVELVRAHLRSPAAESGVPETISGLFERHLAGTTRAGRSLVPVVALAGDVASFEIVLHVGAQLLRSEPATIEAIDDLLAHGLLTEDPAGVRLVHPLLRDTALASLNPVRRATLHEALADSIEAIGGDEAGVSSARHRIAAFMAARLRRHAEAAVREGSAAADAAFEVYAEGAALELYRGVLAAFNALPAADRAAWRARAVTAWLRVASILTRRYEVGEAERALLEAQAIAETDQERISVWSGMASIPYRRGDFASVVALLEEGLASLRDDGSALIHAKTQVSIAWSKLRDGRTGEAADVLRSALPVLEEAGEVRSVFLCLDYLALALEAAGRHDQAADAWRRAEATLSRAGELEAGSNRWVRQSRAVFALHRGLRPLLMGDATTAVRDLEAALQLYEPIGDRYEMSVAHGILASAYQLKGDLEAALKGWETSAGCLEGSGHWYHLAGVHASRAGVLGALGRTDDAAVAAELARRIARDAAGPQTIQEIEEIISGETIFLSFNRRGLPARATP